MCLSESQGSFHSNSFPGRKQKLRGLGAVSAAVQSSHSPAEIQTKRGAAICHEVHKTCSCTGQMTSVNSDFLSQTRNE